MSTPRTYLGRGPTTVPLLIIDDFGMRKLPLTAAEDLLEIVMRSGAPLKQQLEVRRGITRMQECR
jgi:hypothetical protein